MAAFILCYVLSDSEKTRKKFSDNTSIAFSGKDERFNDRDERSKEREKQRASAKRFEDDKKAVETSLSQKWSKLDAEREEREKKRFNLFSGDHGGITTGAADAAKLTDDEREKVAELMHQTWAKASEDFASRARLNKASTDQANGIYVYDISARADRGAEPVNEFREALSAVVGKEKQTILTKGIQPFDCFGGFGKYDIRLEFDTNHSIYKFQYIDPASGRPSMFGSSDMDEFRRQFGDSFDIGNEN